MSEYTYAAVLEDAQTGNTRTYNFNFDAEQIEHMRIWALEDDRDSIHGYLADLDWLTDHFGEVEAIDTDLEGRSIAKSREQTQGSYEAEHFPSIQFLEGHLEHRDGVELDDLGQIVPDPALRPRLHVLRS